MNVIGIIGIAALIIGFAAVFSINIESAQPLKFKENPVSVAPPYYFEPGKPLSYVVATLFVFGFSLLLFGFSAPLAMALEGAKYASLLSSGTLQYYDLLFLVPEAAAMYSAVLLGKGVLNDLEGKENVFAQWDLAKKYFAFALAATLILAGGRTLV